jgi:hypothetical protein
MFIRPILHFAPPNAPFINPAEAAAPVDPLRYAARIRDPTRRPGE